MVYYAELGLRLLTACILGGIIGFERQATRRPAGFRTHILVCVGSALVMITSEFLFSRYGKIVNIDPARMGAQVISGIGFLGAGTIIREGVNVRGLTTAASLWAVSCVGLAIGIGFYHGALAATIIIFLTLIALKRVEKRLISREKYYTFTITSNSEKDLIDGITDIFEKSGAEIRSLDFSNEDGVTVVKVSTLIRDTKVKTALISQLYASEAIKSVSEK